MKYLWIVFWLIIRLLPLAGMFAVGQLYADGGSWPLIAVATVVATGLTFWSHTQVFVLGENRGCSSIPLIDAGCTKNRRKKAEGYKRFQGLRENVTYTLETTFPFRGGNLVVVKDQRYPEGVDGSRRIFYTNRASIPCKVKFKFVKRDGIKQLTVEAA